MRKEQPRCNLCGIPEREWVDTMICTACRLLGTRCHIEPEFIIEERVFKYADKHGLLDCRNFVAVTARKKLERLPAKRRGPKYFLDAITSDGVAFCTLEDMPKDTIFRACRSGKNGAITVCDLVYRQQDGLLIGQGHTIIPPEACAAALEGAMFEDSYYYTMP